MIDPIEPLLTRLPEPAPPPALAATVMARIARESESGRTAVNRPVRSPAVQRGDGLGWLWVVSGLIVVVGLTLHEWVIIGSPPDVTSSRIGFGGLVLMPAGGPASLLLGVGLVLFLLGLFAPLRQNRH
jgi:uncharacterized membrane protein YtjA (UPF0391 family)